ncbi:MAG: hypothetical protein KJ737_02035 [Proteobacteria bacterium]|nr:hypothetical protein [Pseudomonadota bacterium]
MTRFPSLLTLLLSLLSIILYPSLSPCLDLETDDLTYAVHGGPMDVQKGFEDKAFNLGYFIGGKLLVPMKSPAGLTLGLGMDFCLMDGDEEVKDAYGIYNAANHYKLADASLLARYTFLRFRDTTFFAQANGGCFWEKTETNISPLSITYESVTYENTGFCYSWGGGLTWIDHFELYALYNQFEDNELLTITIGWVFN